MPTVPGAPVAARRVFAHSLPLAERYAELLAGEATLRGLIGPREVARLWERHLLNCAVLADLVPHDASVCDVGSGAGLPGLVLAIRRPDLHVTLLEPLLRRSVFLEEAVVELGLENVEVHRARAEETQKTFEVVTARAVAPMDRLARWALPLVETGGLLLAMKGSSVATELEAAGPALVSSGAAEWSVETLGDDVVDTPVTVVRIVKGGTR
jgi:16S rRNA (guanine527-N7)-methyltransferase